MPSRDEFIAAYVSTFGSDPIQAGQMYDILVADPSELSAAMDGWAKDFERRTCGNAERHPPPPLDPADGA